MLQALLKHKLKDSFKNCSFEPSEESKTSSVFGLLQYLPAQTMWDLLRQSCGKNPPPIKDSGDNVMIHFWPRWNTRTYREPDVFFEFERFNVIVEAKKDDYFGQDKEQWKNEIDAYRSMYPKDDKELIFIAFGGNQSLISQKLIKKSHVCLASWQNLLNAIDKINKECSNNEQKRILSDIIRAFNKHNFFCIEWLETLGIDKKNININSKNIFESWKIN